MHGWRLVAATGQFHQVHRQFVEPEYDLARVGRLEAAALEIRGVELDCHAKTRRDADPYGLYHLQQQPGAILQTTAPAVLALVAQGRKKLAQQVAVGSVDLHAVETGLLGQGRGAGETPDQGGNLGFIQGLWHGEHLRQAAHVQGDCRGGHGGLAEAGLHLATGVVDLHPELRAVGPADSRPLAKALQLLAVVEHHAAGAGHGPGIDHHVAGQQQAGPAFGPGLVQAQQLLGRGLVEIGQVFLHRRLGDTVGQQGAVG